MTCEYTFRGTRLFNNATVHYSGQQVVTLLSTDYQTILGEVFWNLSLNGGLTWGFVNETYIFNANRTYRFALNESYTAWWINPEIQVGDLIPIDGDLPVTNLLTRNAPFLVTDLVSLSLGASRYTCWWLTNENPAGVHESFYYEQLTGTLVAAYSEFVQDHIRQYF